MILTSASFDALNPFSFECESCRIDRQMKQLCVNAGPQCVEMFEKRKTERQLLITFIHRFRQKINLNILRTSRCEEKRETIDAAIAFQTNE